MLARENNFDALRFWAALAVLWSHTVPLTQGEERNELMFRLSGGQTTTGTVAVFVFFAISGYLITRSFDRAKTPWHYVRARVLRIMPGLLTVLLLAAFVIGPLVTTLDLGAYFGSPDPYRYVRLQGLMFFGWFDELPGVFSNHPMTVVNGPVWTLRYEAECYGLVFLLGVAGLLRKEVTLALFIACLAALAFFPGVPGSDGLPPEPNSHLDLTAGFLAGALVYQWKIPLDARVAALCSLAAVVCLFSGQILLAQRTLIPYVTLFLAIGPTMVRIPHPSFRGADVSYGMYIWGWPLTQLAVYFNGGTMPWWQAGLIVTPLAIAAGWLSWHLIEKRALQLKDSPLLGGAGKPATHERTAEIRTAHG